MHSRARARERLAVVGVGLIGGSILVRQATIRPIEDLQAVDPRPRVRRRVRERLGLDACTPRAFWSDRTPLAGTVVVLAVPPRTTRRLLEDPRIRRRLATARLVLDTASVKEPIVAAAADLSNFVGGHPLAGSERSGFDAARPDLFAARPFALCPATATTEAALRRARRFTRSLGARPVLLDAGTHDRAVAHTSHVPHLVAWALLDALAAADPEAAARPADLLAGGSLRDATRVAAADPALWEEILAENAPNVVAALDAVVERLRALREAAARGGPLVHPGGGRRPVLDGAKLAALRRRLGRRLDDAPSDPC